LRDQRRLTPQQVDRFRARLGEFIHDLREMEEGQRLWFRSGLRVKKLSGAPETYEMSWAPDGRATFAIGDPIVADKLHIEWLRIGGHEILP